jgi:hypothetical protein
MTSAPEAPSSRSDPTHAFTAHESSRSQALRIACTAIDADQSAGHELVVSKGDANGAVASQRREISDGVTSQWAGLFFVLNLLERAGDRPPADETVAILQAVAAWLRIRPDEPIHDALAALNDESSRPTVPPARIRALRLACLTRTRRPLRRILSRAGRVVITRTHMTIVFALESVRLDVRKAGLDLDPGWLPRLGRVVRFAYE